MEKPREEEEEEEPHRRMWVAATPLRVERKGKRAKKEMQRVRSTSSSFSTLPNGWLVEHRPRPSNPSMADKYYYEPGTGRKFRSLLSVQRYLAQPSLPSPGISATTGRQTFPGARSYERRRNRRSLPSFSEEGSVTPKASKHDASVRSSKSASAEKIRAEKKNTGAPLHNLTAPPAKVNWVLSGSIWSPFMGDSVVMESEKLKWSEAFVLSVHEGLNT